jgi:molybdopterin-binding protein
MPPHQRRRQAECVESGTEITPFPSIHNKEKHFGHTVSRYGYSIRKGNFWGETQDRIVCWKTGFPKGGTRMKYGARNQITGKVTDVKRGDVMSLVKFAVEVPAAMASVITTESLDDLALKPGDTVRLVIKAIHVLPVRD